MANKQRFFIFWDVNNTKQTGPDIFGFLKSFLIKNNIPQLQIFSAVLEFI